MKNRTIISSTLSLALALGIFAAGLPHSAQAATTSTTSTGAAAPGGKLLTKDSDRLNKAITKADDAINARIDDLNKLNAKVKAMANVSAQEKAAIATAVETEISGLTTLKAKIDTDSDLASVLKDEKTITGSFRIYALVIPQGHILAAADRVETIAAQMSELADKLQTRISAMTASSTDVTAMNKALADYKAKVADAKIQADDAVKAVSGLMPDGGDKTKLAANTKALKAARASLKTATADLKAARKDAQMIGDKLKGVKVKTSANATTSVTTH